MDFEPLQPDVIVAHTALVVGTPHRTLPILFVSFVVSLAHPGGNTRISTVRTRLKFEV
jgi:hypothetical protein